jgi:hypothetical protein
MDVDLSDDDLQRLPAADRREVNPPVQVDVASWSKAGQLDYWVNDWVNDRRGWLGRVRGDNGRQRWIKAVDLRPASG